MYGHSVALSRYDFAIACSCVLFCDVACVVSATTRQGTGRMFRITR